MKFWIPWSIDAIVAAIVVGFFFAGINDRTVNSADLQIWLVLLAGALSVPGLSLWLWLCGQRGIALLMAWLLALPALLAGAFIALLLFSNPRWN